MKTALLFPGQGAQHPGMGEDLYHSFSEARQVFDETATVLGPEFIETIFKGPEEKLEKTAITQPAILTVSTAMARVLEARGITVAGAAGLSLGEYSALVAAGALSFKEALPLVAERGRLMQEATPPGTGGMVAIMGLEHSVVQNICQEASEAGVVMPANFNCPGQIVVSGENKALELACKLASTAGAKRMTPLKVSTPFHSSLLKPIESKLAAVLSKTSFKEPKLMVVFNINAAPAKNIDEIRVNLVKQVSNPILWEQSVRALLAAGFKRFLALGPGTSLARLMKRISPLTETHALENAAAIKAYLRSAEK